MDVGAGQIILDTASIQFVLFGLVAAAISNFSRSPVWRSTVLMTASLVFLGLLDHHPTAFIPLVGFLLLGYAGLYLVRGGWSKSLIWILCAVIFAYAWLKKYTVLPEGIFIGFPYFTSRPLLHFFSSDAFAHRSSRWRRKAAHQPGSLPALHPQFYNADFRPYPAIQRVCPGPVRYSSRSRWDHAS